MKRINKRVLTILLAVTVAFFSVGCSSQASEVPENEPIKIAVSCPLTGNLGEYGDSFKKSVELARDTWNANGGVLGRQIETVFGDSKGEPNEAATLAQKVTSDKSIFAQIGDFSTACSMAAQPIYAAANMIQISPTTSHIEFASGSPWSFECLGTQNVQGEFMAKWAYEEGYRKIAILYINSDWGVAVKDSFEEAFKALGGEINVSEAYFDNESDFTAMLTKVRATEPDALYLGSYYNDGSAINVQRERLAWDIQVFTAGTVYSPKFIELGGESVEGVLTNVGFFPDDPTPAAKAFIETYTEKYDKTPDYYGACAFDAFNVLIEAIERADVLDSDAVRIELANTNEHPGVSGEITFDENGDALKSYIKLTVEDGVFTPVR